MTKGMLWSSIILVIIIIVILAYFFYASAPKKEKFAENPDSAYEKALADIFKQLLGREPTDYEQDLYKPYYITNDIAILTKQVKLTAEYIEKNPEDGANYVDQFTQQEDTTLDTYRLVIRVYNQVLDRMPTKYELTFYADKFANGFTIKDLVKVLESSKEYQILQKQQTNLVNGELPGNITDAQVTLDVRTVYETVYGKDVLPDQNLEIFLKQKYIEYTVDKERLRKLILLLKDLDDAKLAPPGIDSQVNGKQTIQTDSSINSGNNQNSIFKSGTINQDSIFKSGTINQDSTSKSGTTNQDSTSKSGTTNQDSTSKSGTTNQDTTSKSGTTQESEESGAKNKTEACKAFINDMNSQYSKYPYDEEYAILSNINKGNAGLPEACAMKYYDYSRERDLYAEEVSKRNKAQVQYTCDRNNAYLKIDEHVGLPGVMDKMKWNMEGTPLFDANQTKVGSILPKFEYKNLTQTNKV